MDDLGNYWQDLSFETPAADFPGPDDQCAMDNVDISAGISDTQWFIGGSLENAVISGGTFNGPVTLTDGTMQITGGTFNDVVDCQANTGIIQGGTFNSDFRANPSGFGLALATGTFNHRISLDNGSSWLYSPNSSSVADPADVRSGVSNLGESGSLVAGVASLGGDGGGFR